MTNVYIDGFGLEAHLPNQIHNQQLNKHRLSDAIDAAIEYFKPWGACKIEMLVLKPRYILQPD